VFVSAHHERLGAVTLIGSPLRYWSAPAVSDVPAPLLDEHRDEILRELRGTREPA